MTEIYNLIDSLKDKKVAIDDVVTTFSPKQTSHKSAWTYMLAHQLKYLGIDCDVLTKSQDIHQYDIWLIALPMEFQGSYNLFGGAQDETADRIQRLLDFRGKIYCLNREMPDVGKFAESRMKSCSAGWAALNTELLTSACNDIETIDLTLNTNIFVLGDSHSVSVYKPNSNICRNDGKTLYGILKEGMQNYIPIGTNHLITYFGNIDVRHHLCRQLDPIGATKKLVRDYFDHLKSLNVSNISVVGLLPIEYEERRIPKTGWHKGTPFYGTLEQRRELVTIFNELASIYSKELGYEFIPWPEHWFSVHPKEFADTYMEKPGSVHLSRQYYHYNFDDGEPNGELQQKVLSLF